ncbi:MAG: GTPase HflX [Clostridia bacterium]|nr:GTPase HflX [Clostridia bacterium]
MKTEMTEKIKAVLVGVHPQGGEEECSRQLAELARLLDTAGGECFATLTQMRPSPDNRTCIGSGKLEELKELCAANGIELAVFDTELSPAQIRNIEDALGEVRVLDRSMLILDIFAYHATSAEGKLQVELAQLQYTAPRLVGKGTAMSRLGGGIGTRGPGESKLEIDRRRLKEKEQILKEQLSELERTRLTMRAARDRSGVMKVAIVGYTNAGKSTLLNRMTGAGILAEDKLFATLDPTTRKFSLPSGMEILLTDTVGFIRKLPHHLIKAFKSTLDEAVYSDILMILVDASDPEAGEHLAVTEQLLSELGASEKPTLYVLNKCDKADESLMRPAVSHGDRDRVVSVSALTGEGMDELCAALEELARLGKKKIKLLIPNSDHAAVAALYRSAEVHSVDYGNEGTTVVATVDDKMFGMMKKYLVD